MSEGSLEALCSGVELLSLDAGNTVIFLDHARLSRLLAENGFDASAERLIACEGEAKRLLERGEGTRGLAWEYVDAPGARGWGNMVGTICARAGVPVARVGELLARFWESHVELNLWSVVPEGLGPALDAFRARGGHVVIVSNSEGMLDPLFAHLGIARHFDLVVDSGKVGVEKPDPGIWQFALRAYPTPPDRVLHLGDTWATDVVGAQRCGFRAALIDPYGHYVGMHEDVPRVPGVVACAEAIVKSASPPPRAP